MTQTYVRFSADDLAILEFGMGKAHPLCHRVRTALSELENPTHAAYRDHAYRHKSVADDVEVDRDAVVSIGNDGAYVMAWMYVGQHELQRHADEVSGD